MPAPDPFRPAIPAAIQAAAADWLARRDAGLSPEAEARFSQWLAADPRHAAAWNEIETAWRAFDQPRQIGEAGRMINELSARRQRRRWRVTITSTAVAAAAVAAVWMLVVRGPGAQQTRPVETVAHAAGAVLSKPERRVLADGSVVELKSGTQIEVNFTADRRAVQLVRGEAHFEVTKDAARPFVVSAATATVRAVGTAFAVRLDSRAVDVLVTEGRVAVDRVVSAPPPPVFVGAGQALLAPSSGPDDGSARVQPISSAEIERRLAWRVPKLELSNTPLAEVVALLNGENRLQLSVAEPALAQLRLSGTFRADNAEGFARLLEAHYGVRVDRQGENTLVLRRAP